ncbi:MAG: MFS transporter [Candidatus Bathyarchaeales archaeon]
MQLYILELHGTVIDVSLAVTLYNIVSIPSVMLWGFITDRFNRRRPMIVASFLSTSIILLLFLAAGTIYSVVFLYILLSLVTSVSTTPINLLILENERKDRWATAFARFSMITTAGQTLGLLLSAVWLLSLPLKYLVVPLSILSLTSTCLALLLVKEPPVTFERHMIVMERHSFLERLKAAPYMFLKAPRLTDFRRIFRTMKYELTRFAPILYLSIFMFYISSGLFNTSFVPSLQAKGFSNLTIFSVTTIAMIAQTLSFKYAGRYVERRSPLRATIYGLLLRTACYGILGTAVYMASSLLLLASALILYPLAAGLAYAIYYTALNVTVFHVLGQHNQGSSLGVYSALVGFATVTGSSISGLLSFHLGFHITFITAAVCLICSAMLVHWLARR